MKFLITFKMPDAVDMAIERELPQLNEELLEEQGMSLQGIEDRRDALVESNLVLREEMLRCAEKFVSYGELVTISFDTETGTATVVAAGR